jgi:hypothetical protein
MADSHATARALWQLIEPIHAVAYFAPEPVSALKDAGYRGYWMGYFAGRAAPLGPVGPELVHAVFYNFRYDRVARALPAAWEFAPPAAAVDARGRGSVAALRRALGSAADGPALVRAAELAGKAAAAAPIEGRPLFASYRTLPVPADPLARLWHAATLLREHRGDGHVAALLVAGIGGRESHVLQHLAIGTPRDVYGSARDFDDGEWEQRLASLRAKDLVGPGGLTALGVSVKTDIEASTDALAAAAYATLTRDELAELVGLLRPIAQAVVRTGDIPLDSPMGLDLRTI